MASAHLVIDVACVALSGKARVRYKTLALQSQISSSQIAHEVTMLEVRLKTFTPSIHSSQQTILRQNLRRSVLIGSGKE